MILRLKNKIKKFFSSKSNFKLHSYQNKDGDFDYEKYKKIQEEGNKRKIEHSWVTEEEITFLSSYIKNKIKNPTFAICHGTRRGLEQKWFSEKISHLDAIGTDISETAKDFPNSIHWDFHEENPEWLGKADFIYSNSFDHSYSPEKALNTWMNSLNDNGLCIIEHTKFHGPEASNELDPFGATLDIMPYLVLRWSKGKFSVREILSSPHKKENYGYPEYLIIQKNI